MLIISKTLNKAKEVYLEPTAQRFRGDKQANTYQQDRWHGDVGTWCLGEGHRIQVGGLAQGHRTAFLGESQVWLEPVDEEDLP